MYRIRKKFRFEAAHVLDSSYSKDCQNLHGHSYIVELFFESIMLNDDAMLIDFGHIKDIVKPIIDKWDHSIIVSGIGELGLPVSKQKELNVVELGYNPTAEVMAFVLWGLIRKHLPILSKVRVHETETGYAEYEGEDN